MTLHEAFEQLISKRAWYTGTDMNSSTAQSLKMNYKRGLVTDDKIREVLKMCGFKKIQEEKWKAGN